MGINGAKGAAKMKYLVLCLVLAGCENNGIPMCRTVTVMNQMGIIVKVDTLPHVVNSYTNDGVMIIQDMYQQKHVYSTPYIYSPCEVSNAVEN